MNKHTADEALVFKLRALRSFRTPDPDIQKLLIEHGWAIEAVQEAFEALERR